jgi:hypothetical protein
VDTLELARNSTCVAGKNINWLEVLSDEHRHNQILRISVNDSCPAPPCPLSESIIKLYEPRSYAHFTAESLLKNTQSKRPVSLLLTLQRTGTSYAKQAHSCCFKMW